MKCKFFFILLLTIAIFNVSASAVRIHQVEENGFEWYLISEYPRQGAEDRNGNTLIPLSRGYELVNFAVTQETGWFLVRRNGKGGCCDINGNEIIAPNRYTYATFHELNGHAGYFYVEVGELSGACDIRGREIIPCRYKGVSYSVEQDCFIYRDASGNYVPLSLRLDNQGNAYSSSSGSSNSSSYTTIEFESIIAGTHGTSSLSKAERYRVKFELNSNNIIYTLESSQNYGSWTTIETHTVNPASAQIAVSSNGLTVSLSENRGFAVSTSTKMVYIVDKFGNRLNDYIGDKWFLYHKTDFSSKYESLKSALLKYNWRVKN